MLVAGTGGHAVELIEVISETLSANEIAVYNDLSKDSIHDHLTSLKLITSIQDAKIEFQKNCSFVVALGNPLIREKLYNALISAGGKPISVISLRASFYNRKKYKDYGLNIMPGAFVSKSANIGFNSLIHVHSSIHHDSQIGRSCEISPGARILGNVHVGNFVSIGANATILPGLRIGDNARVGAGAVVTKNIEPGSTVVGIPAHPLQH